MRPRGGEAAAPGSATSGSVANGSGGVHIRLGEPFWRAAGVRELVFALEGSEGLSLRELCGRLAVSGVQVASDLAEPPLFVLNDRILSSAEAHAAVVHDGDRLLIQLMVGGG